MTFIITLISLCIERFFDWSHLRKWQWFTRYQTWLNAKFASFPPLVLFTLCIVPPVLLVGLINCLLHGWLYGVFKLMFGVMVLMYCLGPSNFWAEVYASIRLFHDKDPALAIEEIKKSFGIDLPIEPQAFHRTFTNALFVEANRRIFAVFFWFILAGPVGAVLYRTVDLARRGVKSTFPLAKHIHNVLDWLPVRVFTLIFALGGHFTEVTNHWRHSFFAGPQTNDAFLAECGIAALDVLEAKRLPEDGTAEKETLALLDRSFVIALVFLALFVLV